LDTAQLNHTSTTMVMNLSPIPASTGRISITGINIKLKEECHEKDYSRNYPDDLLFFIRFRSTT
jgi:hypothetical protein